MSAYIPVIPAEGGKFKLSTPGTELPQPDGMTAVGTSTKFAREDHAHPDTAPKPATEMPLKEGAGAVGTSEKYAREDHIHPNGKTFFVPENKVLRIVLGDANIREGYIITCAGFALRKTLNDNGDPKLDTGSGLAPYNMVFTYLYEWKDGNGIFQYSAGYNSYTSYLSGTARIENGKLVLYISIYTSDGFFQKINIKSIEKINVGDIDADVQIDDDFLDDVKFNFVDKSLLGWG
jgi:hypothetical protein